MSDSFGHLFIGSLKHANLKQLTNEITAEVISDIPILGTLHKACKSASSVQSYLFLKKLLRFLCEIKTVPKEERQRQVDRMSTDSRYSESVGENILLLLDRVNEMRKAKMLGKVFRAFLESRITTEQLQMLNHAIDRLNVDLAFRMSGSPLQQCDEQCLRHLVSADLADVSFLGSTSVDGTKHETGLDLKGGELKHVMNDFGRTFADVVFRSKWRGPAYQGGATHCTAYWEPNEKYVATVLVDYAMGGEQESLLCIDGSPREFETVPQAIADVNTMLASGTGV